MESHLTHDPTIGGSLGGWSATRKLSFDATWMNSRRVVEVVSEAPGASRITGKPEIV